MRIAVNAKQEAGRGLEQSTQTRELGWQEECDPGQHKRGKTGEHFHAPQRRRKRGRKSHTNAAVSRKEWTTKGKTQCWREGKRGGGQQWIDQ